MKSSILFLLLLFSSTGFATEVDNFTVRENFKDSSSWLNKRMNDVLEEAATKTKDCDLQKLQKQIYKQVGGGLYAKIELWSKDNPNVVNIPIEKSIYHKVANRYVSHFGFVPQRLSRFYTEGNIRLGDNIIGDDKLGHFAGLGYTIYYYVKKKEDPKIKNVAGLSEKVGELGFGVKKFVKHSELKGDELALAIGEYLEDGQWGMSGPGVKSYGDLAANWEGYQFWSSLTDGENPYFVCENNKFVQKRQFDWGDYATAAWDEAVNCSERNEKIEKSVNSVLKESGLKACPQNTEICSQLAERYKNQVDKILHPNCR